MTAFFGDYDTTETVYIPFNTFDSNDPSASVTATTLLNTDCHVHKDGSVTQRTSSAGETLSIDFDSVTGNHLLALDLSDDTDAGFYAAGSTYQVRIEGATVDGANINAWIGAFSIGRMLRPTTAGRTLDVTATGAAGIDWANVENPTTAVDLSATDIQLCDTITTYTGNTVQTGDSYARIGAAGASLTAINLPNQTMDIVGSITGNLSGSVGSVTGAVGSVTGAVGSVTGAVGSVAGNVDGSVATATNLTNAPTSGDLTATMKTSVQTAVDAAIDTAIAELGVAAPTATPTLRTGMMLLYMALRNKLVVQTSGTDAIEIYNNAGTKIAAKAITDDGSDYTEDEMA